MSKEIYYSLSELPLVPGESEITVSTLGTGLLESQQSEPASFTMNADALRYNPIEDDDGNIIAYECIGFYEDYDDIQDPITAVSIPATFGGMPVVRIGYEAFRGINNLLTVEIPASVEAIMEGAFSETAVGYIRFAKNSKLRHIGIDAFYKSRIREITIPRSVNYIWDRAFANCWDLTKVEFEDRTFNRIYVGIPRGLLTNVDISYFTNGVETRGEATFVTSEYFDDIYSFTLPIETTHYKINGIDENGMHTSTEYYYDIYHNDTVRISTYDGRYVLKVYTDYYIGAIEADESYLTICSEAFRESPITELRLPVGLVNIGDYAFSRTNITTLYIPDSVADIYDNAFRECPNLTSVYCSNRLSYLPDGCFADCHNLETFEMRRPKDTNRRNFWLIGAEAFINCESLKAISFPFEMMEVGAAAFSGCTSLAVIDIGNRYGWFYCDDYSIDKPFNYLNMSNPVRVAEEMLQFTNYRWYRIEQMTTPAIEIQGTDLIITDPTELANQFKIFVNGEYKKTVDVN